MINITTDQLLFLGDIHGKLSVIYDYIKRSNLSNITILQVGDFGYGFGNKQLITLNKHIKSKSINLIVLRGNHDNYYNHFPELGKSDYKKLSNIKFLKHFDVLLFNNKKILCIGGATTIDRIERTIDLNYWKQESIRYDGLDLEVNKQFCTTNELKFYEHKQNYYLKNIDCVISHTAPEVFHPYLKLESLENRYKNDSKLKDDLIKEGDFLDNVLFLVKPNFWYTGHFHQSVTGIVYNTKFRVLAINELVEFR
jgi:predicted phosphodiesterase